MRARVIVNPSSGARSGERKWPRIKAMLDEAGLRFDGVLTEGPMHAAILAGEAADLGYDLVVAVGGDGTINEVVNGLIGPEGRGRVDLGIIFTGTANDFARNLDLPPNLERNCHLMVSPRRMDVDVGLVECIRDGQPRRRYFVNVSGAGFDADWMEEARRIVLPLGPKGNYLAAFLRMAPTYEPKDYVLDFGDRQEKHRAYTVLVSNGRYSGRIPFNPQGDLADGLFEVMALDLPTFVEAVASSIFSRTEGHPGVQWSRAASVCMKSGERLSVQADGEVLGELPARFQVLPGALRVVSRRWPASGPNP